ncbi:MAG: hypothetical protein AAB289_06580 [Chloroflexota bacterium]
MCKVPNQGLGLSVALSVTIAVGACSPAPAAPPTAPPASGPAAGVAKPKFDALFAEAKKSNGKVRYSAFGLQPEVIRGKEAAFEKQFGVKITIEQEPGHVSRDIPPKVLQGAKTGKGIVDMMEAGSAANHIPQLDEGAYRIPPWEALTEQWPAIKDMRQVTTEMTLKDGKKLNDYCMVGTNSLWSLVYNTNNVKADEVKNITYDDLLTDKWKGRVILEAQAASEKQWPLVPGWPIERVKAYRHNSAVNGAKIVAGGFPAQLAALTQGEGDITAVSWENAYASIKEGAPLQFAFPEFVASSTTITCVPKFTPNDPSLGAIFWAWDNFEGQYLEAELGSGGARPLYPPEADKFPLAKILAEHKYDIKDKARVALARTAQETVDIAKFRKAAIDGSTEGKASGQKVAYPWACEKNHPACVR